MFGRTATAPLLEHEPKVLAVGDSPIGQGQDVAGRRGKVVDSSRLKQQGERPGSRERPIRELLEGVLHNVAPRQTPALPKAYSHALHDEDLHVNVGLAQ